MRRVRVFTASGDSSPGDVAGCTRRDRIVVQRDRALAIRQAIAEAGPGDTVLIAGKGHETYQDIAGERRSFDDAAVARRCLEALT